MKNKNKQITRKEFVLKTSKVAGGLILCPTIFTALQSCSNDPVSSSDSCSDVGNSLFAQCPNHGAKFNTEGCPIQGPATEPLNEYQSELNDNELIIEASLIINLADYPDLKEVGSAISLDSNEIDSKGLLIYRKSENEFNVLSRECSHNLHQLNPFEE